MAHKILADRFMERESIGGPAWHRLGRVFPTDRVLTASEAVQEVAGDVVVEGRPRPLWYLKGDGTTGELKDHQVVVRNALPDDPEERVFGVTTDRWQSVSYVPLAKALDDLCQGGYKVETCGLIEEGSLCFISFRGPDFSVKGDDCQDYFIVNLSNQIGNAHKVMAAPVRVVCFQTNMEAQTASTINLEIPHGKNADARIKLAATVVGVGLGIGRKGSPMKREDPVAVAEETSHG